MGKSTVFMEEHTFMVEKSDVRDALEYLERENKGELLFFPHIRKIVFLKDWQDFFP